MASDSSSSGRILLSVCPAGQNEALVEGGEALLRLREDLSTGILWPEFWQADFLEAAASLQAEENPANEPVTVFILVPMSLLRYPFPYFTSKVTTAITTDVVDGPLHKTKFTRRLSEALSRSDLRVEKVPAVTRAFVDLVTARERRSSGLWPPPPIPTGSADDNVAEGEGQAGPPEAVAVPLPSTQISFEITSDEEWIHDQARLQLELEDPTTGEKELSELMVPVKMTKLAAVRPPL